LGVDFITQLAALPWMQLDVTSFACHLHVMNGHRCRATGHFLAPKCSRQQLLGSAMPHFFRVHIHFALLQWVIVGVTIVLAFKALIHQCLLLLLLLVVLLLITAADDMVSGQVHSCWSAELGLPD
jgi:hypothetical protein